MHAFFDVMMNKVFYILSSLLLLTSCAEQYNIAGNSTLPCLDGKVLYLRVSNDDGQKQQHKKNSVQQETVMICLDSCKVIHGQFRFEGDVDSAMMAMLYTGNDCVMPLVLESGKLNIQVDKATQRVSGSPLNEKLYSFFKKRTRLDREMWELQQATMRMMREGCSPVEIQRKMGKKTKQLAQRTEELETKFVMDNYNNVLGPGYFRLLCSQFPSPIMTDQIRCILKSAPTQFLNDPFVRCYMQQAEMRMSVQSGIESIAEP